MKERVHFDNVGRIYKKLNQQQEHNEQYILLQYFPLKESVNSSQMLVTLCHQDEKLLVSYCHQVEKMLVTLCHQVAKAKPSTVMLHFPLA